jgi:hypothetical protein
VYDEWFRDKQAFQRTWTRVGEWKEAPTPVGEPTVVFYARNGEATTLLRDHLREFAASLPAPATQALAPEAVTTSNPAAR